MRRTQIYLPEELHRKLQHKAKAEASNMSYIIRVAVEKHLETHMPKKQLLTDLIKKIQFKGPKNLSQNIDSILYDKNEQ